MTPFSSDVKKKVLQVSVVLGSIFWMNDHNAWPAMTS
jgi:hypothetical protein